ncbi:lysylphosphatidylglycerol synthase transmembrane domain-containing protein [Bordetella genomosp. 13]|uniref:TIGR00374 family protein n=1 Tax=Bordetella genomosp. 13 TaxID=463040 RepID=A0A1W6Z661_9BORD|nr:lysylphosphatidylglycerol synthase transmembrane domain-containing protein [Bordetella genomosp. 13]ARP92906.1 TIGR00374 family protein [Bordetella genomosp. 13]
MTVGRRPASHRWIRHAIGLGITVVCLIVLFRQVRLSDVLDALASFEWRYLIAGIASLACGYALRILRWSMMLRATGANAGFAVCSAPFLASIALNNILPLRLGDVVRALVFPSSMGITKTVATSSLFVERLIDLMTLLASFAIGLLAVRAVEIPANLVNSAVTLALMGGAALSVGLLASRPLAKFFLGLADNPATAPGLGRVYRTLGELLHGFDAMSRPRLLLSMLAVSMLVWIGEAGLFYFVLIGAGMDGTPVIALLVMAMATLATLVPSSPGYVGPFHLAAFTAISLAGGATAQAGSYAVVVHLALWLSTTLAGAVAIWIRPELLRAAKSQAS